MANSAVLPREFSKQAFSCTQTVGCSNLTDGAVTDWKGYLVAVVNLLVKTGVERITLLRERYGQRTSRIYEFN